MACLIVLPRVIAYWRHVDTTKKESKVLAGLSNHLFNFGSLMAIFAITFGFFLWQAFHLSGPWLHYKTAFVGVLIVYHLITYKLLLDAINKKPYKYPFLVRIFSESALLFIVPVVYYAVSKGI